MKKLFIALLLSFSFFSFAETIMFGLGNEYAVYVPAELHNSEKTNYKASIVEIVPISSSIAKVVYRIQPINKSTYTEYTYYFEKNKEYTLILGNKAFYKTAICKLKEVEKNRFYMDFITETFTFVGDE